MSWNAETEMRDGTRPEQRRHAAVESRGVQSLPPIKRTGQFASSATPEAPAKRMRVGSEMYWAVVAPGATMLRRMWLLGVLLLALGIGAPIALVVWIVVERDELVDLALDDRFLRAITLTLAVALFARLVAVIEVAVVAQARPQRRPVRDRGLRGGGVARGSRRVERRACRTGPRPGRRRLRRCRRRAAAVRAAGDTVAEEPTGGTVAGDADADRGRRTSCCSAAIPGPVGGGCEPTR